MSQLVLKVTFNEDVRRLKSGDLSSEQAIRMAVSQLYNMAAPEAQCMKMCYTDDEGDMCTLTEATLPDALKFAEDRGKVLRLQCTWGKSSESTKEVSPNPPDAMFLAACNEEGAKQHAEQEISSKSAHLPMGEGFVEPAKIIIAEAHVHLAQHLREMRSVATEARTAMREVRSSFQDQVARTVDGVVAAGACAQVHFDEASQNISDRFSCGVAELQASTSDARQHVSGLVTLQVEGMRAAVGRARRGRSEEFDVEPNLPDEVRSFHDSTAQEFADKVQVHISNLMCGARVAAANVRAKAKNVYTQTFEGDIIKSAFGFTTVVTAPDVSNASSSSDESSVEIESANAEVACDVPEDDMDDWCKF